MPRKDYATMVLNGKMSSRDIPTEWISNLVKRIYKELGLTDNTRPTYKAFDKGITQDRFNKLVNMLLHLPVGYEFAKTERATNVGQSFWNGIRHYEKDGTLALLGSQYMLVTKSMTVIRLHRPDSLDGIVAQTLKPIYTDKTGYYMGYNYNPSIELHPQWEEMQKWIEPFRGIKNAQETDIYVNEYKARMRLTNNK